MKIIFNLTIFFLSLLGWHAAFGSSIKVYFIPFEVETYIPVTVATIECKAHEVWLLSRKNAIYLSSIIAPVEEKEFDERKVRIKIIGDGRPYYIDSSGVVLKGALNFQIDKIKFNRLSGSIVKKRRKIVTSQVCPDE